MGGVEQVQAACCPAAGHRPAMLACAERGGWRSGRSGLTRSRLISGAPRAKWRGRTSALLLCSSMRRSFSASSAFIVWLTKLSWRRPWAQAVVEVAGSGLASFGVVLAAGFFQPYQAGKSLPALSPEHASASPACSARVCDDNRLQEQCCGTDQPPFHSFWPGGIP